MGDAADALTDDALTDWEDDYDEWGQEAMRFTPLAEFNFKTKGESNA